MGTNELHPHFVAVNSLALLLISWFTKSVFTCVTPGFDSSCLSIWKFQQGDADDFSQDFGKFFKKKNYVEAAHVLSYFYGQCELCNLLLMLKDMGSWVLAHYLCCLLWTCMRHLWLLTRKEKKKTKKRSSRRW
jgi:hypothetical protein